MAVHPVPPAGARSAPAGCPLDVAPPPQGASRYYVGRRREGVWVVDGPGVRRLPHAGRWSRQAFAWRDDRRGMLELAAALLEDATGTRPARARAEEVADALLLDLPAHAFVLTDTDLA